MLLPARVPSPFVVALVATQDRPALLRRALVSIAEQTRAPNVIILVEDAAAVGPEVRRIVGAVPLPSGTDLIVLENRRTPGAAGAWNSGIDEATRRFAPARSVYVAILDDDDWWDLGHVESCLLRAATIDADMVAAGIVRHDDAHPDGRLQEPPTVIAADVALVQNPHIQGSNLFVRLSSLLEAGTFDESLRSTTDRDLLVRLADLRVSYAAVPTATVHHDARGERPRLSSAGSSTKSDGLARFWSKYRLRMSASQREVFEKRARSLFATNVTTTSPAPPVTFTKPACVPVGNAGGGGAPLVLVVGIAADGDAPGVARVTPLLEDLLALQRDHSVAALDVVVVENGDGETGLRTRVDELIHLGLRCYLADVKRQREDAAAGFFGVGFERRDGRVGISEARAMTQRYVHRLMRPGSVAWILDDDKRLAPLVHESGRLVRREMAVIDAISSLRASGADVVLGIDTGAAPLPAAATLRTQLVDLSANVAAMRALGPTAAWADRTSENIAHSRAAPDYYYDLTRLHTWHLELPCWFGAEGRDVLVRDAFRQLADAAPRMLAGEQVFRPLFVDAAVELTLRPSIRRGGSTLVFDADALVDVPQIVPAPDGRPTRRSDMVWSILNAQVRGRRVEEAPLAVFHDRRDLDEAAFDVPTLVDDIRGYALYSTLLDIAKRWPGLEGLTDEAGLFARDRYRKYLVERSAAFVLSFHRSRGAARVVRTMATAADAWWQSDPEARDDANRLAALAERVLTLLEPGQVERVRTAIAETPLLVIAAYMRSLRAMLDASGVPNTVNPEWIRHERARIAQAQIERHAEPAGALRLLGVGHEGVVFTDGHDIFKYLDLWRARASDESRAFLRGLIGAWAGTEGLYPLKRLIEQGQVAILVYAYEASEQYAGGYGPGLVTLLRECHAYGVAFRNMHPQNLRVVGERVRLIDYGADLVALDAAEWRHMVRRAWLCWRWPHDPEIKHLMRRALHEDLPELTGWERLERAVLSKDAKEDADALVLAEVLRSAPGSVLDYGCGAGKTTYALARRGVRATGFDVRRSPHWTGAVDATFTSDRDRALADAPFDSVICALVLCTLNEPDYQRVIADLRASVRDGGSVVISVCNPFHTHGGDTPFQERHVPRGGNPDRTTSWSKRVRCTDVERRDIHRPLHIVRRDLLRAGLAVEGETETETVDLDRLEPASDFLVIRARAVPEGPKVSLLVRASAMEWQTLAVQVRHLVKQLEGPTPFHERVVVLDSRRADFLRQYDSADREAARVTLEGLIADRTVDRIVDVQTSGDDLAALGQRWFGFALEHGHTADGAPVAASLAGFEVCSGDYVLHADDDLLIARLEPDHDYLRELVGALEADPDAVCASLNTCHDADQPWSAGGACGPWRVEVRGALFHRARLLASRPWPGELRDGVPVRNWHRALDERIRAGQLRSLRGGRACSFFVHPPNEAKRDREAWLAILDRVEAGQVPRVQCGQVDLRGGLAEWLGPERREKLVVIACGRNVPAGRVARFRESLEAQSDQSFGLLIIEDGGARVSADAVRHQFGTRSNATLLTLRERRGGLANIVWALRYVCTNPASIVVLVDLDDALLGASALARIVKEFDRGADLTVGGMRRTDKTQVYPVDFEHARERRGGNVWQHVRAFRRELFACVPDHMLRLDGQYVDLAWDWALMLPLVEVAESPRYIDEPLYLHEPSGVGKTAEERSVREEIIERIVAKASLRGGGAR